MERSASLGNQASRVRMVALGSRVTWDLLGQWVLLVIQAAKEQKVLLENLDELVNLEIQVL